MPLSDAQRRIVRIRAATRSLVTAQSNELANLQDDLASKPDSEKTQDLAEMIGRITRARSKLAELDASFETEEDLDSPLTDEEWQQEIAGRERYARSLDILEGMHRKFCGMFKPNRGDGFAAQIDESNPNENVNVAQLLEQLVKVQLLSANTAAIQQLPPVNVRSFGGDPLQFLQFWNEFKATVHDKESLPPVTKFRHLRQLLTGKAASAIESIPVTNENYPKAIDYLIRRYGDVQQIVIKIFTDLLDATQGKEMRLRQLIDQTNNVVATLQSLNIGQDYYSLIMYPLLLKAISRSLSLRFISSQKSANSPCSDIPGETEGNEVDTEAPFMDDIIVPDNLPQKFNADFRNLLAFLAREAQSREQQDQICNPSKDGPRYRKDDQPQRFPKRSQAIRDPRSEPGSQVYAVATAKEGTDKSSPEKTDKCLLCCGDHYTARCKKSLSLPLDQRVLKLENANACSRCLRLGHHKRDCTRDVSCPKCKGEHYSVLCPTKVIAKCVQDGNSLLPTGHVRLLSNTNAVEVARFLMDTGSQRTFVTSDLVKKLSIPPQSHEWITIFTFGSNTEAKPNKLPVVTLKVRAPEGIAEFQALVVPTIAGSAPPQIPSSLRSKANLPLAELENGPVKIDILLGAADVMKLLQGPPHRVRDYTFINSQLGYVVIGPQCSITSSTSAAAALTSRVSLEDFWNLEHLGILPHELAKSDESSKLIEIFEKTVKRSSSGQYETILNLDEEKLKNLADNQSLALRQIKTLTQRFQKDNELYRAYSAEIQTFFGSDFAEKVPQGEKPLYFMPHFPVVNLSKITTKIRPVFNASSHARNALSLNDCIKDCPNLLPTAMDTLIKFRRFPVALTGDISKAYLRIGIQEQFRNYLCFYWLSEPQSLQSGYQAYRMKVNTFGLKDAQFNMIIAIRSHAEKYSVDHPQAVRALLSDLYSDDLLSGGYDDDEVIELQRNISKILKEAGLEMKKWRSNSTKVNEFVNCDSSAESPIMSPARAPERVLGILWSNHGDIFRFESQGLKEFVTTNKFTKRTLLGALPRLYDPAGFISPFTMQLKLILQDIHKSKYGLDAPLPSDIARLWIKWIGELDELDRFSLPRFYGLSVPPTNSRTELHLFVDASDRAYAAVIYIKVSAGANSVSNLLVSKARTVPLKQVDTLTIPKKELLAALCGARLLSHVKTVLNLNTAISVCWTDSSNVLAWIRAPEKRVSNIFIQNRVQEIRKLTNPSSWNHVPGVNNPADIPSRGAPLSKLVNNPLWLRGPDLNEMVSESSSIQNSTVLPLVQAMATQSYFPIENYSCLHRGVRVLAWVARFIRNLRARLHRSNHNVIGGLLAYELLEAKQVLIRQAQRRCFGEDMLEHPRLRTLSPILDDNQILRLEGRLENLDTSDAAKNPILLGDDPFTRLLIAHEHSASSLHLKTDVVLTRLRRHFWILRGRQIVRTVIFHCNGCKRNSAIPCRISPEGVLPGERVELYKVFQNVGIDYAGPFIVKDRMKNENKAWIVLFSCCVTRAVYLDLVEDLTAVSFLLVLKRFVAAHGAVEKVITDNALYFSKANKLLRSLWDNIKDPSVQNYFGQTGILWSFNPPRAAWYGGHFERLIGLMKTCLRHAMKQRKFQLLQFLTILKEIEAIMNSRPLTVVNVDFEAPEPLTPGHFLAGRIPLSLPSGSLVGLGKTELAKMWRVRQQTVKAFWKRWKEEYIVFLRSANKRLKARETEKPLEVGDVVIIKEESTNRQFWHLGCVHEILPSRDKVVRKYSVRTAMEI